MTDQPKESSTSHFEQLTEEECHSLLGQHEVGRIGFVADGRPVILPVNYVLDGNTLVIRTSNQGVTAAIPMTEVAFEIDQFDEIDESGWSVLVQGFAQEITSSIDERSEQLRKLFLTPWAGPKPVWIAITPSKLTGRRLIPSAE